MDSEALRNYEARKRETAKKVDEWFIQNAEHWREKAREILAFCGAWDETWGQYRSVEVFDAIAEALQLRLDPMTPWITAYGLGWRHLTACELGWPPPPTAEFHPILYFMRGWTLRPTSRTFIAEFTEQETDKALACYYAALIILHDTAGQGYQSIAANIWPSYKAPRAVNSGDDTWMVYGQSGSLWNVVSRAFNPGYGDKTEFINAAIRAIEEDLSPKPLTSKAQAVYELLKTLPPGRAMTGPEILERLDYKEPDPKKRVRMDDGTFKRVCKELRPYGLSNRPRVGYYLKEKTS